MDETRKNLFDSFIKLAELRASSREKRIEREWKVSIGMWAVGAASIAYLKVNSIWALALMIIVVAAVHAWFWVRTNYNSSEDDRFAINYFTSRAIQTMSAQTLEPLSEISPDPPKRRRWGFLKHPPVRFQILATILIGITVALLARQPTPSTGHSAFGISWTTR